MVIDVAISSCARIDILEKAIKTFLKYVKCKDGFRLIICEDKVDDAKRQKFGRKWIEDHKSLFDKIIFSDKKLTYVYCFSEILNYIESPYFFRLEDDVVFHENIDVDKIIEFMIENKDILSQTIFRRKKHDPPNPIDVNNNTGRRIQLVDSYSIATGVFNIEWTRKIIGMSGTNQCHEAGILTPAMLKLSAKSSVVYGKSTTHALDCIGDLLGYMKGAWKNGRLYNT